MTKANVNNEKILITGGHLTPALAVIDEFKKYGYNDFLWIGRKKTMRKDVNLSAEFSVIQKDLNIPFKELTNGKIIRFWDVGSFFDFLFNIIKIPIGFIQSIFILLKDRPVIIISFGGYIAVPVVIAGWFLRIPIVTHEQTVVVGKANRIIAKFSKKIFVSWKESLKYFGKLKCKVTGNPVRKEIFSIETNNYKVNEGLKTIYITGGNQGAHIINKTVIQIIETLLAKYNVIHQTGLTSITNDFEKCDRLEKSLTGKTKGTYIVRGNIFGVEIGEVFGKADLVVSRAGANISTELLVLGKPAILIPIPWSLNNEQLMNAKMLGKTALAEIIEEKDLTPEALQENIEKSMKNIKNGKSFDGKSLKTAVKKAKEKVNLNAANIIVKEVLKMIQ